VIAMRATHALRDEHFNSLADQFTALVAEQSLGLGVDLNDRAIGLNGDYGIWNSFKELRGEQDFRNRVRRKQLFVSGCRLAGHEYVRRGGAAASYSKSKALRE
jgi:hypothetical protein